MTQIVEVRPRPAETVVANLPPGTTIRVVRDGQEPSDFLSDDEVDGVPPLPVVAEIPAPELNGFAIVRHMIGLRGLRNGRHKRDRSIWHKAAGAVSRGGVAYVLHQQVDWYGRPVWMAVSVRKEH